MPDYTFAAQTYILGQSPLSGTLQSLAAATVQTSGSLRLAYWANPFVDGPSTDNWWTNTYTLPDVALNHPRRWTWQDVNPNNANVMTPTGRRRMPRPTTRSSTSCAGCTSRPPPRRLAAGDGGAPVTETLAGARL